MENWILFGVLAAIGFGGLYTIDRSFVGSINKNIKPFSYATVATGISAIFLSILMLLTFGAPKITIEIIKYSLIIGTFGFLASTCYYYALRNAEASYVAPMTKLSVLLTVIFGALFFDETLTPYVISGALLIFIGSYLITEKQNGNGKWFYWPKPNFALLLVILTALFWSIRTVFDKTAVATSAPIVIAVFSTYFRWLIDFILGTTVQKQSTIEFLGLLKENRKWVAYLAIRGMFSMVALASFYFAVQQGVISRVYPLINIDAFFAVIFGALFLNEKETYKRLIGSGIVIAGAIFLTM